jgi:hypothetical protein
MWNLIKTYDQLHLLINEIFLIKSRMLSFISHKLPIIKQVHNQFMDGFHVSATTFEVN